MRIQNNIMAMNTHRMYTTNNSAVSKSAEKLSSGYRINRAGDDAAGLAISEKMRAQVRGLNMASKNSQDAISLVQTAEGALQEVHSMLQRMNELSVQSATGTNADFDRSQISAEFEQLKSEIDQIAETTDFNNMKLLDGSQGGLATMGLVKGATEADNTFAIDLSAMNVTHGSGFSVTFNGTTTNFRFKIGDENISDFDSKTETLITLADNAAAENKTTISTAIKNALDNVFAAGVAANIGKVYQTAYDGTAGAEKLTISRGTDVAGGTAANVTNANLVQNYKGGLVIQVGAEQGNVLNITVEAMNIKALKLDDNKIDTQAKAGDAITATRDAVNIVSNQRSILGAMQNRLEHKISNLDNTSENLAAAESRIRDCDLAKEMTNYTKNNILSQAATAMLAQANSAPQNVLSLLQ